MGGGSALIAALYLLGCWTARAFGSAVLLSGLGFHFSPTTALCVLCLSAAAGVDPDHVRWAGRDVGATAGILLALGVGKDIAINFSLASGMLLTTSASAAAVCGTVLSLTTMALARHRRAPIAVHTCDLNGTPGAARQQTCWEIQASAASGSMLRAAAISATSRLRALR